jgi:hypothetical protein
VLIRHRSLPDSRFCTWSQAPAPLGPLKHVTFKLKCVVTKMTPE